jgi:hypothetical protein
MEENGVEEALGVQGAKFYCDSLEKGLMIVEYRKGFLKELAKIPFETRQKIEKPLFSAFLKEMVSLKSKSLRISKQKLYSN